jgi:hypothetical protein
MKHLFLVLAAFLNACGGVTVNTDKPLVQVDLNATPTPKPIEAGTDTEERETASTNSGDAFKAKHTNVTQKGCTVADFYMFDRNGFMLADCGKGNQIYGANIGDKSEWKLVAECFGGVKRLSVAKLETNFAIGFVCFKDQWRGTTAYVKIVDEKYEVTADVVEHYEDMAPARSEQKAVVTWNAKTGVGMFAFSRQNYTFDNEGNILSGFSWTEEYRPVSVNAVASGDDFLVMYGNETCWTFRSGLRGEYANVRMTDYPTPSDSLSFVRGSNRYIKWNNTAQSWAVGIHKTASCAVDFVSASKTSVPLQRGVLSDDPLNSEILDAIAIGGDTVAMLFVSTGGSLILAQANDGNGLKFDKEISITGAQSGGYQTATGVGSTGVQKIPSAHFSIAKKDAFELTYVREGKAYVASLSK